MARRSNRSVGSLVPHVRGDTVRPECLSRQWVRDGCHRHRAAACQGNVDREERRLRREGQRPAKRVHKPSSICVEVPGRAGLLTGDRVGRSSPAEHLENHPLGFKVGIGREVGRRLVVPDHGAAVPGPDDGCSRLGGPDRHFMVRDAGTSWFGHRLIQHRPVPAGSARRKPAPRSVAGGSHHPGRDLS
jgi:hypothetical protein